MDPPRRQKQRLIELHAQRQNMKPRWMRCDIHFYEMMEHNSQWQN
jgi:hypothetical protein